jgi:murein DD-endopeptidase MepM/ murein hydrolase activator NlpD
MRTLARFACILLIFLTACAPAEATPSPVAAAFPELEQAPGLVGAGAAPALEPLRFQFPTPGAEPVSGWRPPLYPIPWALTENDHFYFARPIAADEVNWPLADYRYGGVFFRPDLVHTGVDIDAKLGAPVLAAGPGTVIWAGWGFYSGWPENEDDPYGIAAAIRHDFGYQGKPLYTMYGHMSQVDVAVGQYVQTGDQLGLVGITGHTTGPHLHFEVRLEHNSYFHTRNPELWIAPPQGWGVLAGRMVDTKKETLNGVSLSVKSYETGRIFWVKSYGKGSVNSDEYYNENLVIGDLPAGWYTLSYEYDKKKYDADIKVLPGRVSYFTFREGQGFTSTSLPEPLVNLQTPAP